MNKNIEELIAVKGNQTPSRKKKKRIAIETLNILLLNANHLSFIVNSKLTQIPHFH